MGVPRTIQLFMVLEDRQGHRPGEIHFLQNIVAYLGMEFDDIEFVFGQPARFAQNFRRDGDLTDIMQKSHNPQSFQAFRGQSHLFANGVSQVRHPPLMSRGIRVPGFHRGGQARDRALQGPVQLRHRVLEGLFGAAPFRNIFAGSHVRGNLAGFIIQGDAAPGDEALLAIFSEEGGFKIAGGIWVT